MIYNLEGIFEQQRLMMSLLDVSEPYGIQTSLSAAIGMACESAEVLDLMNKANRPWKNAELMLTRLPEEMADTLFFLIELAVTRGISAEDIYVQYEKKFVINCARVVESSPLGKRFVAMKKAHDWLKASDFDVDSCTRALIELYNYDIITLEDELSDNDVAFAYSPVAHTRRMLEGG